MINYFSFDKIIDSEYIFFITFIYNKRMFKKNYKYESPLKKRLIKFSNIFTDKYLKLFKSTNYIIHFTKLNFHRKTFEMRKNLFEEYDNIGKN